MCYMATGTIQLDESVFNSANVKIRFKNQIATLGGNYWQSDPTIDDVEISGVYAV